MKKRISRREGLICAAAAAAMAVAGRQLLYAALHIGDEWFPDFIVCGLLFVPAFFLCLAVLQTVRRRRGKP